MKISRSRSSLWLSRLVATLRAAVQEFESPFTVVESSHSTPGSVDHESWTEREAFARELGRWFRGRLQGQQNGLSGRDRFRLSSRYYLVAANHRGERVSPPLRVFQRLSDVKQICYRENGWGESIFIGVPSLREAKLLATAAHLPWPDRLE